MRYARHRTSKRAAAHSETRVRERRRRLALEAARLMTESGIRDFRQAKLKAAQRLGIFDDASLPRNREIAEALQEHQRLFLGDAQARLLRQRREAALRAMDFFAAFEPRLVGAVLSGEADEHSAICLHLYTDDPEAVPRFLHEHGIPAESANRTFRLDRERLMEAPAWLFSAEELSFDLSVLPTMVLRQAPLDRIDEKPMPRASRATLQEILLLEEVR